MVASTNTARKFILASRQSQLAQAQTVTVLQGLQKAHPDVSFDTQFMSTAGDNNQSQALYLLGGKALWTKELEVALKDKSVDFLIHSFKDVPTVLPGGCEIAAILEREDPVDSLVMKSGSKHKSLDDLPPGSVIGTSSVRRVAQLKRNYPHLEFLSVRGNLATRLRKLDDPEGPYIAIILAKAGMVRVDLGHRITMDLPPPILFHAVSQGALAVEIRSDDTEARALCAVLTHRPTQWRCEAERACLRVLEGGCSVPVGIQSEYVTNPNTSGALLSLIGCVTALDGSKHVQHSVSEHVDSVDDAIALGEQLAKTLMETGAKAILDDILVDRETKVKQAEAVESAAVAGLA